MSCDHDVNPIPVLPEFWRDSHLARSRTETDSNVLVTAELQRTHALVPLSQFLASQQVL